MKATTVVLAVALTCAAASARADQLQVAAGTTYALGSGRTQLNCGTLTVNGTLQGQTGTGAGLGNVEILGGLLQGDAATFLVSGTWNNAGIFDAGSSTVKMNNGCTSSLVISGNNRFCTLEVDAPGATLSFPDGETWATCKLVLKGAPGAPLKLVSSGIRSMVCGLYQIETSNVTYNGNAVSVSNCVPPVPAAQPWVLALLALVLAGLGGVVLRRRMGLRRSGW